MILRLVVIDNFDFVGLAISPHETDSPLIVDSNAVGSGPISTECLQTIAGGYT